MRLLLIGGFFFIVLILAFILIARKGRKLRTTRVLPPEAVKAFLEISGGEKYSVAAGPHFYIGKNPDSNVVLASAHQDYEVCIFYHRKRFAFQTLSGGGIFVNGEEQLAGYLSDGDVLEIAGESFTFRSS
jgi:hypothetical protein